MDDNSEGVLGVTLDRISSQTTCALCQRILSSDNETDDLESISVCGDCKFLLLEDMETASPDVYRRRIPGFRRRRYDSSESIESIFSQQFSQMIMQTQSTGLEHDNQSSNGDVGARLVQQHTSSRTTPSGSRRWRRVFSDTGSDGFDSFESESNVSFRRYRILHGEGDTLSYSVYGGNSEASVDGQSFLENENFGAVDGGSDLESDTDIDPMNAGLYRWNSDDDDDDSEWEEADVEGNMVESLRTEDHLLGSNAHIDWRRQLWSPEVGGTIPFGIRDRILAHTDDLLTNFEDLEAQNDNHRDSGDYPDARGLEILLESPDARGLEILLESLDETESSRRGAPPASVSFVNNLPQRSIDRDDDDELDNMACAICKDSLTVGTLVNQLPCFHLYHPSCLSPWLNARNTCPLCRYELPTDDKDYEERKRSRQTLHIHQHDVDDDVLADEPSQRHRGREEIARNRWFFLAAAPIVSLVGVSLTLWLGGKHSTNRRSDHFSYGRDNRQRRWWPFFF